MDTNKMFPHLIGADNRQQPQCRDRIRPQAAHLMVWIAEPKRDVDVGRAAPLRFSRVRFFFMRNQLRRATELIGIDR
jgi:hypothetical protein